MYVYFIRTTQGQSLVKIGKSGNVTKRLESLRTGCAFPLELIGTLSCRSEMHASSIEKQLHRMHKWARMRGEWFRYDPVVQSGIREILAGDVSLLYENAVAGWRLAQKRLEIVRNFEETDLDREFSQIFGEA